MHDDAGEDCGNNVKDTDFTGIAGADVIGAGRYESSGEWMQPGFRPPGTCAPSPSPPHEASSRPSRVNVRTRCPPPSATKTLVRETSTPVGRPGASGSGRLVIGRLDWVIWLFFVTQVGLCLAVIVFRHVEMPRLDGKLAGHEARRDADAA